MRAASAPAPPGQVPGYTGVIPGKQHVYARTYGMSTSELGGAHAINKQDKNQFISFERNTISIAIAPPL